MCAMKMDTRATVFVRAAKHIYWMLQIAFVLALSSSLFQGRNLASSLQSCGAGNFRQGSLLQPDHSVCAYVTNIHTMFMMSEDCWTQMQGAEHGHETEHFTATQNVTDEETKTPSGHFKPR